MSSCGKCSQCAITNAALFITAQYETCTRCCGTTQDIPAGLYQPKFQDTASLGYKATVTAKNTHTHAHTQINTRAHWQQKHLSEDKDDLFRQEEKQTCRSVKQAARKKSECAQTQQRFSLICVFLFNKSSYSKSKYYTCREALHIGVCEMSQIFCQLRNCLTKWDCVFSNLANGKPGKLCYFVTLIS